MSSFLTHCRAIGFPSALLQALLSKISFGAFSFSSLLMVNLNGCVVRDGGDEKKKRERREKKREKKKEKMEEGGEWRRATTGARHFVSIENFTVRYLERWSLTTNLAYFNFFSLVIRKANVITIFAIAFWINVISFGHRIIWFFSFSFLFFFFCSFLFILFIFFLIEIIIILLTLIVVVVFVIII